MTIYCRRGSDRKQEGSRSILRTWGIFTCLLAMAVLASSCASNNSPTVSANDLVSQGLNAESLGQSQQAIKDFNEATAKNPTDQYAYYDLGEIYQEKLSEPSQAAAEYRKALLADENYKPALFNLAILETSLDPQEAVALYTQLLALNPSDPNVNFNLGLLLVSQGEMVEGHADLQKAIAAEPSLAKRLPAGVSS